MISHLNTNRSPRFTVRFLALVCLLNVGNFFSLAGSTDQDEPVSFALKDQFNKEMKLEPVFTKPIVVTVADRIGAEQLPDWIPPLSKEFGESIQFFAVADLRSVPRLMKGMVRRGFKKQFDYGVAMDWDGAAADQMNITADQANLLVLDTNGKMTFSIHGAATEENLAKLKREVRATVEAGKRPDPSQLQQSSLND